MPSRPTAGAMLSLPDAARIHIAATRAGTARGTVQTAGPREDTAPTVLRASLQATVLTGHPLPGATVRTADSRASLRDIARTERLHREDTVPTVPREDTVPTDPPKASLPEAIAPTVPREGPPTLPSAVSGLSTEIRPLSARISRVKTPAMPARVLLPIPATMPTTRRQA